ncbi:MAG: hypothetical protein CVU90_00005 [Firmicutes bacterium HGW-Firmicutes-15]|nr:MAG: hypothetical protein CVU90_00005 [Firmicutes bacterium HGW-Firmicutes-15]
MNITTFEISFVSEEQDLDSIIVSIEILRRRLADLVERKGNLDPEVLAASQELDDALNEYYKRIEH